MLSEFIRARLSYPAVPLAGQQAHQRSVQLGPLVLESNPFKNRTPAVDRSPTCLTLLILYYYKERTIALSFSRELRYLMFSLYGCL